MVTNNLPSGYKYDFFQLNIKPMTFLQVLDYVENCPNDKLEKFAFDYAVLKADDPNVDNLLITDLQYVMFVKQVISIDDNEIWHINIKCPKCGRPIKAKISLDNIRFNRLDQRILQGLDVELDGDTYTCRIPTVHQFMNVFTKYRQYRNLTDLRLIKILSLFDVEGSALNKLEEKVKNATHDQIKELVILEQLMLDAVNPIRVICENCVLKHEPEYYELEDMAERKGCSVKDLTADDINEIKFNYGGFEASITGLTSSIFQDVIEYSSVDPIKIQYKQILQDN